MATFSSTSFSADDYDSFRPRYPASFYELLGEYVGNLPVEKTIDLGCGTGVATYPLLKLSQSVLGLDISPGMIKTANELKSSKGDAESERISFEVGSTEQYVSQAPPGSVSLITAAECIHWFQDFPKFFKDCAQLLQPNGVLAYWFYNEPIIVNYSGASTDERRSETLKLAREIYNEYVYKDAELMGPHWEMPGRGIVSNFCREATECIPYDLYTDAVINEYEPEGNPAPEPANLNIRMEGISLGDYMKNISTYSALHKYAAGEPGKKEAFLESFMNEFETKLGWNRETTRIDVIMSTGYVFLRKQNVNGK